MRLAASPEWLPYDLAERGGCVRFLRLNEAAFAEASFLDGRVVGPQAVFATLSWARVEAEAVASRPRRYIFHIGHVGSTLLARLIGAAPAAFSLREPAILRALAAQEQEGGFLQPPLGARLALTGDLLSRVFREGQTAVIKATSFASELGPRLLAARSDTRALLMAVVPDVYIASVLGGPNSLAELRVMADARAARLSRRLGHPVELTDSAPGVLAAMSWLCEAASLAEMAIEEPAMCLWLNFETFLQRPEEHMERVLSHFGLPLSAAAAVHGPLMRRYSKDPQYAYDHQTRQAVIGAARQAHGQEVRAGMAWLNQIGARSARARLFMQTAASGLRHG